MGRLSNIHSQSVDGNDHPNEGHRVGSRRLFRALRLGGDELGVERVCQARDDFVQHVEEIGERLVEPKYQQGFRLVPAVLPASPSGLPSRASRCAYRLAALRLLLFNWRANMSRSNACAPLLGGACASAARGLGSRSPSMTTATKIRLPLKASRGQKGPLSAQLRPPRPQSAMMVWTVPERHLAQ